MRFKLKYIILPVFIFLSINAISQAGYDKIYSQSQLDIPAEMPLTNAEFSKFVNEKIIPIIEEEVKAGSGRAITKLRMLFTISEKGEIIIVEFPGLEASSETHRKLAEAFMKMGTWKPGVLDKKNVCSEFTHVISCIKWQ